MFSTLVINAIQQFVFVINRTRDEKCKALWEFYRDIQLFEATQDYVHAVIDTIACYQKIG
jgi:hypothetical protein